MVPMRDLEIVETSHEPENAFLDFQPFTHFEFIAGEQVREEQGAFHEPEDDFTDLQRLSRNDLIGARNLFRSGVECSTGPDIFTEAP